MYIVVYASIKKTWRFILFYECITFVYWYIEGGEQVGYGWIVLVTFTDTQQKKVLEDKDTHKLLYG